MIVHFNLIITVQFFCIELGLKWNQSSAKNLYKYIGFLTKETWCIGYVEKCFVFITVSYHHWQNLFILFYVG